MRIAVGLDLNLDGFDWLLDRAVAFTERAGGSLDLVYIGEGAERQAKLDELLATVPASVRGAAVMIPGDPAEALVALTADLDALVVGPREPQGVERLFLDAMAVRILRRSHCPVYVPRTERFGHRDPQLLMGVDLRSDRLEYTLQEAGRWAGVLGGHVNLVHALPRSMPSVRRAGLKQAVEREWKELHEAELERVNGLLGQLQPEARGTAHIRPGEAEDVLIDLSAQHDLIVVGNRDRKGLGRFLLGGVARNIVVRAQCDVLVLPTADTA